MDGGSPPVAAPEVLSLEGVHLLIEQQMCGLSVLPMVAALGSVMAMHLGSGEVPLLLAPVLAIGIFFYSRRARVHSMSVPADLPGLTIKVHGDSLAPLLRMIEAAVDQRRALILRCGRTYQHMLWQAWLHLVARRLGLEVRVEASEVASLRFA